jgi:hypothetical protein
MDGHEEILLLQVPVQLLDICLLGSSLTHDDYVSILYIHQLAFPVKYMNGGSLKRFHQDTVS